MGRHEHERFFRFGWWLPELQWGLHTERLHGYFWSASATVRHAWSRVLSGGTLKSIGLLQPRNGFSVRCVRD